MATSTERSRALRARRAAAVTPAEGQAPRDADELLLPSVAETLAALDLKPEDAATAKLAQRYAKVIDEARDPAWGYEMDRPAAPPVAGSPRRDPGSEGRADEGREGGAADGCRR